MKECVLIAVGGSAGSIEPLMQLVASLPAGLPAAVCVAVHFPSYATSALPKILSRAGQLPARHAVHEEKLEPGRIYVAPPDHHLLVADSRLLLSSGARQNGHRPAIDPLFLAAARAFGPRAIGVVLSGLLDDGTLGLLRIKERGGVAMAQHPDDAVFDWMPRSALSQAPVDHVLPIAEMGPELVRLARERSQLAPVEKGGAMMGDPVHDNHDSDVVAEDITRLERGERPGEPGMFTCPGCGGVLWELQDGDLLRYRCRVGHSYSADSLEVEQSEAVEEALWPAARVLEECASLARRFGLPGSRGQQLEAG